MGARPLQEPCRGEIFAIKTDAVACREARDHHWIVLTPEAVNRLGMTLCAVIATGAKGTRATGLTVQVAAAGVTGVAICTQVRSFDLVARLRNGSATRVGMASAEVMDEIAARIASLIEPVVPAPQSALGHSARAVKPSRPGRGTP